MDMLVLKNDMRDKEHGYILLKANTPYIPIDEVTINSKNYLVYQSEMENEEVLIPINSCEEE